MALFRLASVAFSISAGEGLGFTDAAPCVAQIHSVPNQPAVELKSALRRGASSRRSSYALSQGAGPGYLITSGTGFHSAAPVVGKPTQGRNSIASRV